METAPLAGLRVVEVALGTSVVGAGMAASLPGALLRDLGADVARVQPSRRATLDAGVESGRVWDRGKDRLEVDDEEAADVVTSLAGEADVLFLCGPEALIERRGLGYPVLGRANPRLVHVRVRPSVNALGPLPDLELLVAARAGLLSQIRHHQRGRPAFPDLPIGQAGAALSATVGALARLYEREASGLGGWVETSLYDGIQAILPMILGRVERHSPATTLLWKNQGPTEGLAYPCADGKYLQLWFGAKGAYEAFLEKMGDEPSVKGYNADLVGGAMADRSARWAAMFATKERAFWLEDLAGNTFRCEPVLRPGEGLLDPHVREIGLCVDHDDPERGPITVLGPVMRVMSVGGGGEPERVDGSHLLTGVRVLDLSAYLAGPIGPLVLAELGADVVKVEPATGDVHRSMEPMFAAGQRGKRSIALDLKAPDAVTVLERLFRWSDVVHHNSRVGLADKLGYDEATVRSVNPNVVYSFASGFGETGPRALLPANDHLMQALSGVETAQGGHMQPPTFLVWGAIDVAGGWVSAVGILAGLYARRRTAAGQSVASTLLGAGLLLKSGAFAADTVVSGPVLDGDQTGYGAAYRIYRCGDDAWLALAVPDAATWTQLRRVVGVDTLPADPPPLRIEGGDNQAEEDLLAGAFAEKPANDWLAVLGDAKVPAELVVEVDRAGFTSAFVDDPVNQQLGRVTHYEYGDRGRVDQPTFPPRLGPAPRPGAWPGIAAVGEHTAEVLEAVGINAEVGGKLAASETIQA
jgi:crotonobetainyl-CoA:carnitine CoA-transferase CaiB-like acyl-CoA transferase